MLYGDIDKVVQVYPMLPMCTNSFTEWNILFPLGLRQVLLIVKWNCHNLYSNSVDLENIYVYMYVYIPQSL